MFVKFLTPDCSTDLRTWERQPFPGSPVPWNQLQGKSVTSHQENCIWQHQHLLLLIGVMLNPWGPQRCHPKWWGGDVWPNQTLSTSRTVLSRRLLVGKERSTEKKVVTSEHHLPQQLLSVGCSPEALASPGTELMETSCFSLLLLWRSGRRCERCLTVSDVASSYLIRSWWRVSAPCQGINVTTESPEKLPGGAEGLNGLHGFRASETHVPTSVTSHWKPSPPRRADACWVYRPFTLEMTLFSCSATSERPQSALAAITWIVI